MQTLCVFVPTRSLCLPLTLPHTIACAAVVVCGHAPLHLDGCQHLSQQCQGFLVRSLSQQGSVPRMIEQLSSKEEQRGYSLKWAVVYRLRFESPSHAPVT